MSTLKLIPSALLLATTLTGCGKQIVFSDSIDLQFDLFRQDHDVLSPYVVGAELTFCADSERKRQLRDAVLRSSNDDVFELETTEALGGDGDHICATAIARAAGTATVEVRDGGDTLASIDIEVREPTHAEFYAAGPLLADRDDLDPRADSPKMLLGGTATFQVRYFDGETRLHGMGALEAVAPEGMVAESVDAVLIEEREWIQLTAEDVGEYTIELATPAGAFEVFTVEVVEEDAIADVALHGSDEARREEGDPLMVYAQAYGEEDEPIYGVEYEWTLAGDAMEGRGDLFNYVFDPTRREDLSARHGDLDATVEIRAGEGTVDSSNDVGCSVGGRSGGAWAVLMLGLLGLVRRRKH